MRGRDWDGLLSMRCGQQIFHCWRGLTIIYGAAFVVMILALDIVYALLDPRIKYN